MSPLPMGRGTITGAAHGPLPCPAPATLRVISDAGLPTFDAGIDFELVTPTGACLVAALATAPSSRWPDMAPSSVGYGCGSKELGDRANLLRVVLGSHVQSDQRGPSPKARARRASTTSSTNSSHHHHHHHNHGHHGHTHA